MLLALVGSIVAVQVTAPINCNALYAFNFWAINMAILCASTLLMIRTVALWNKNRLVILLLATLGCVHWAILWRGMFILEATYSPEAKGCTITSTDHVFLNISFLMTMGVNFVILLLTAAALARQRLRSHLWKLLFQDGLVNFCVTFVCNATPAILNIFNLNTLTTSIAIVPAATISSVAACRLFMRLRNYSNAPDDSYIHPTTVLAGGNNVHYTGGRRSRAMGIRPTPEVRVTTTRITAEDFSALPQKAMRSSSRLSADLESELGFEN
ncbi:uncharacterized protein PHACADRAFT_206017 [Phanerochaete carnosa HHB-10118-sp]|uniref:G-protein coupled receptors family 1 profile domain-containing protein n=1 Tax=Phanerochaete carnosa (strain HHB-10118-sp) TaxID=650164 RepID=K5W797_PHACS|nr:uncharacterized protein PHACADRAFT_206017 [Phanerochaete carnosa HHB-10118-sp]EKM59793.1 hypothetical protein PHACADRAFT_206017 [Phanerochaete carnosa HHB-10118-sp]